MASLGEINLCVPDKAILWLKAFEAQSRAKKWKDNIEEGSLDITDNFLSCCGLGTYEKLQCLLYPNVLEKLPFSEIKLGILKYLEPKRNNQILERINFFQMRQIDNESLHDFVIRLKDKIRYCQFDHLKTADDPMEELLIVAVISGLKDSALKRKALEYTTIKKVSIEDLFQINQNCKESNEELMKNSTGVKLESTLDSDINYTQKMIKNCKYCGKTHQIRQCPAFGKKCNSCGKLNHFSNMCNNAKKTINQLSQDDADSHNLMYINSSNASVHSISVKTETLKIQGNLVQMQVDTGASVSIISSYMWNKLGKPMLTKSHKVLEAYDGHTMKVLGELHTTVETGEKYSLIKLIVVNAEKPFGLLGRDYLSADHIQNDFINQNDSIDSTSMSDESEIKPLSAIQGVVATMERIEGTPDKFCAARPVPLAIQDKVKEELSRLEKLGIITPITAAKNASPVVWIKKKDGSLRMCADFKVHVNGKIKSDYYPLPNIEHIFSRLKNANCFAKIDLRSAYWQIELDQDAKELSVINTTKGLYMVNRLQMGMKNSSYLFQRVMETILKDIKGILIYQDDIAVFAPDKETLNKRLNTVLLRLKEKNVTLNESKCINFADEITFLGYKISAKGIEPDNRLVEKIKNVEIPRNRDELKKFIGLINYFGRLIPHFSKKIAPLNSLMNSKEKFAWTTECKQSFDSIILELSNAPLVKPYDLNKEVTVSTDASGNAIGAILTQENHPVIYVSRSLSVAEKNYSNIEREALAIFWAISRLKYFLLGRKFQVQTDHKPLEILFRKDQSVPDGTSARIIKWSVRLMPYDFEINYVPGSEMQHADAMSRMKFKNSVQDLDKFDSALHYIGFEKPVLDEREIINELECDMLSRQIMQRIKDGNWQRCSQAELPFKNAAQELTIHNKMIYKQYSVFIPPRLREKVFDLVHYDNHSGIQTTLNKLKLNCWWPGMQIDTINYIKNCSVCNRTRPNLDRCTNKWPNAGIFERLHIDWAYVSELSINVLIIVDAGSGWIEAFPTSSRETKYVIKSLRTVFSRFGVPQVVVSDNAQEFKSVELNNWLLAIGVKKIEVPIYSPKSNGLAERGVQTIKNGIKAYKYTTVHSEFSAYLQRMLLHYRVSTMKNGKSPAEHIFGRKLRLPVVSKYPQGQSVLLKNCKINKELTYLMPCGTNTSWLLNEENVLLASNSQLADISDNDSRLEDMNEIPNSDNELMEEEAEMPLVTLRKTRRNVQPPQRYGFD